MNTANHLKALADQYHHGTLEISALFDITESINNIITRNANQGKYEVAVLCSKAIGFNEDFPVQRETVEAVAREIRRHGFGVKAYVEAEGGQTFFVIKWGVVAPPPLNENIAVPFPPTFSRNNPPF